MDTIGKIFTWWEGATFGTLLWSRRLGEQVGTDAQGNTYFRERGSKDADAVPDGSNISREKRWVIYAGQNDASRVPAEWHGWLHGAFDDVPESFLPPPKIWEAEYSPNATGTRSAYRPQGALEKGGKRARAVGDYEAWSPGGSES
ncbi:MAG: NADH:ubiquinone oxidoreductase subunit NDUFA12 [Erythrobacter sp.]